ncbi:MAG: winged helix-turn-helix transcriptional regulator [Candidatus Thorarchaeota archaeon]
MKLLHFRKVLEKIAITADQKPCPQGIQEYCNKDCPFRQAISILGKRYTFDILRVLSYDKAVRFKKIAESIPASTKTITERLGELVKFGVVKREAFAEIPPRVEYSLTEKGLDLEPALDYIRDWGVKWYTSK